MNRAEHEDDLHAELGYRTAGRREVAQREWFSLRGTIADDAYLFLWRVSAMVEEAYRVARAWGFVPKSEIVWEKDVTRGRC